jgi:hypothetical protein
MHTVCKRSPEHVCKRSPEHICKRLQLGRLRDHRSTAADGLSIAHCRLA